MRNRDTDITEGVIWKQLLAFFFPIMFGTFFQQLYNTVDAIVVGKYVGTEALAAVGGATAQIINLIVGFFVGLASGGTVILSQYYGARDNENVSRTVHTAVALALTGGAVLSVVGYVLSPAMLRMLNTPENVMDNALSYIRICFAGMIPSLIYNFGGGLLRAVGDSRRPLYFLICACSINIVMDILLVLGFGMGVAGAALATILSQAISAVLVVIALMRTDKPYRLQVRKIRFHKDILLRIVKIGLPAGLNSVFYTISNTLIQAGINGFGTVVMAAQTAYSKLDAMFWMIINAFGISITTFVGQNFGAKRYDRMRKSTRICLAMAAAATILLSVILLPLGRVLFGLFTDDEAVLEQGLEIMHLLVPCYITYICVEIFTGTVRGAGDSLRPTIVTLVGICGLRLFWILVLLPNFNSVRALMACYPISWTVTSIALVVYYFKGGWLERCKAKAGHTQIEKN